MPSSTTSLQAGDPAPDFALPASDGAQVRLSDHAGRWVVLYFYPRDDTPGCTTEGQEFSAQAEAFAALDAIVLGISKDTLAKHEKFAAKRGITVPLLSDADDDTCARYGVWGEKQMYGKTFEGITRTTFLIGPDGMIEQVWPKVKVKGHVAEVLDALRAAQP